MTLPPRRPRRWSGAVVRVIVQVAAVALLAGLVAWPVVTTTFPLRSSDSLNFGPIRAFALCPVCGWFDFWFTGEPKPAESHFHSVTDIRQLLPR